MSEIKGGETGGNSNAAFSLTQDIIINQYESLVLSQFYHKLGKGKVGSPVKNTFIIPKNFSQRQRNPTSKDISILPAYTKNSSVFLPTLTSAPRAYKEKVLVNQSVYVHERVPNRPRKHNSEHHRKKKLSLQSEAYLNKEDKSVIRSAKRKELRSFREVKMKEMQLLEIEPIHTRQQSQTLSLARSSSPKLRKSQQMLGKLQQQLTSAAPNIIPAPSVTQLTHNISTQELLKKSSEKLIEYPICNNPKLVKLQNHATVDVGRQLLKQKSKIERIISVYHKNKAKIEESLEKVDHNIVTKAYEDMEKINIKGEQSTYAVKLKQKARKERSFSQSPKVKFTNWKTKEMPYTDVNRAQVYRLLSYYSFIRQSHPMQNGYYKVYLGDGNNSQQIGRLLKSKGWWSITEDISEAHLIWTQLPHEEMMKKVKPRSEVKIILPPQLEHIDSHQKDLLKHFLKHKGCNFFSSLQKLLHPYIYHKVVNDIMCRFKLNRSIKHYTVLREVVSKLYGSNKCMDSEAKQLKVINHCHNASQIGDKKNLLFHIQQYCSVMGIDWSEMIPRTVHIDQAELDSFRGLKDNQNKIEEKLGQLIEDKMVILKPGESTNRGHGITVHANRRAVAQYISRSLITFPQSKTYVVQEYLQPLLYQDRKFDIRVWALFSGNRLWFYKQGYIRTTSRQYTTRNMNRFVHLTNDAVQKNCQDYGRYEPANKVSFTDMDRYLKKHNYDNFYSHIVGSIKELTHRLFEVGGLVLGQSNRQFQLFGLDFLVDRDYKVWLIECNTNPSLEICCSLMNRLVPNMLDSMLSIAVDPLFPPTEKRMLRDDPLWNPDKFNWELLLDLQLEGKFLREIVDKDQVYYQSLREINSHKLPLLQDLLDIINQEQEKAKQKQAQALKQSEQVYVSEPTQPLIQTQQSQALLQSLPLIPDDMI